MKKLLLIEDDQYSAQSLTEQFSDFYHVDTCNVGDQGLQQIIEVVPDLILLDIMLPGKMNGFDVLREVKQLTPTQHIPVIMLTNLDNQKPAAIEAGAEDCFVKANTTFDQIHTAIEKALAKPQEKKQ
jgi:CheY-like chemotaxis protein